jgi:hypothetical protein
MPEPGELPLEITLPGDNVGAWFFHSHRLFQIKVPFQPQRCLGVCPLVRRVLSDFVRSCSIC